MSDRERFFLMPTHLHDQCFDLYLYRPLPYQNHVPRFPYGSHEIWPTAEILRHSDVPVVFFHTLPSTGL